MWCAVGREGTGVGSVRGCVWGHVLMIVMQTTRLENVGAFCGVCSGLARVAVYLYLIFLLVQLVGMTFFILVVTVGG